MKKCWFRWLLVIVCCLAIFNFTADRTYTSKNTRKIVAKETYLPKKEVREINVIVRKLAHMVEFGTLAMLIWWSINKKPNAYIIAWILATLFAVTDEWHQVYVPMRTPSVNDVVLDSLGAMITLYIIFCLKSKEPEVEE